MTNLVITPPSIEFVDCNIGQTYSASFEIRNAGKASVQLKFKLPNVSPTTRPFNVRLPADTSVAPGMSRSIKIEASPVSTDDINSQIVIIAEPEDIQVPITIRRNKPNLQLPDPLSCGHCLVGATKQTTTTIQNSGPGRGKFIIFNQDDPQLVELSKLTTATGTSFDETFSLLYSKYSSSPSTLRTGEFLISSRCYELTPGKSSTIEVAFSPTSARDHRSALAILSDSKQKLSLNIAGSGCLPSIQIFGVDGAIPSDFISLLFDPEGSVGSEKSLRIRNAIAVPLKFKWKVIGTDSLQGVIETFTVSPEFGVLEELSDTSFTVSFKPPKHGTFSGIAKLFIEGVPACSAISQSKATAMSNSGTTDIEVFRINTKGICPAPRVALEPPLLFVPSKIGQGEVYKQDVSLLNLGAFPIRFQVADTSLKNNVTLHVKPSEGIIAGKSNSKLAVSISLPPVLTQSQQPANEKPATSLKILLSTVLSSSPTPSVIELPISISTLRTKAILSQAFIEFGLVQNGHTEHRTLQIKPGPDLGSSETKWNLKIAGDIGDDFEISETSGVLKSDSCCCTIDISFSPKSSQKRDFSLELLCDGERSTTSSNGTVLVRASSDSPLVVVDKCQIDLGSISAESYEAFVVNLTNISGIDAHYSWREKDSPEFSITFTPRSGIVPAFGSVPVEGLFHPKASLVPSPSTSAATSRSLTTAVLAAIVDGMSTPIGVSVSCVIGGLVVKCTLCESGEQMTLPFTADREKSKSNSVPLLPLPEEVQVMAKISTEIELENVSSLETAFTISATKYNCNRITENHKTTGGLSISCEPNSFRLVPNSKQRVHITCFADLPGLYSDFIALECDGPRTLLPMKLHVYGSPVVILPGTVGLDCTSQTTPQLNWGEVCPFSINHPTTTATRQTPNGTRIPSRGSSGNKRPKSPPQAAMSKRVIQLSNRCAHDISVHWRFETAEGGVSISAPFSALPASSILSAFSASEVSMIFGSHEIDDFKWKAIGEIHLIGASEESIPSTIGQLPPIVIHLQAKTVQPKLECQPDKKIEFLVPAYSLFGSSQTTATTTQTQFLQEQQFKITNGMKFALDAGINVKPPLLFDLHLPKELLQTTTDGTSQISPGGSFVIGVAVNLNALGVFLSQQSKQSDDTDVEGSVDFMFHNGSIQQFPLVVKVRHAKLSCPNMLDFGPVPIGETRSLGFQIQNLTQWNSHWMITTASHQTPIPPFSFQPSNGISQGIGSQQKQAQTAISVTFSPKQQQTFSTALKIQPDYGNPITITLKGVGTYNERVL